MQQSDQPVAPLNFVFTGTSPRGRRETDEVTAASSTEAVSLLRSRGWSDITLHTDELIQLQQDDRRPRLTAREQVAVLSIRRNTLWKFRLGLLWRRAKWAMFTPALAGALLAMLWWNRAPKPQDILLTVAVVIPIGYVLWVLASPDPAALYHRVLGAVVDGRWSDVLALLPRLERKLDKTPAGRNGLEVARLRAGALIRLGRIGEGFDVVRILERGPDVPRPNYLTVLAEAHLGARQFGEAEEIYERLVQEYPDTPAWWMALAEFRALGSGDAVGARAALGCIDRESVVPQMNACIDFLEGVIAILERNDAAAIELLMNARISVCNVIPDNPLRGLLLVNIAAFHAVSLARRGDRTAASRLWAEVAPVIEVHGSDVLRALCREHVPEARTLSPYSGFHDGRQPSTASPVH